MNRSIAIVAALVGLVVLAPSAAADSGSGDTSAPDPSTPTTETPATTVTETPVTSTPPATTTTTTTPATTTTTPATTTTTPTTTTLPTTGTPTTTPTTGTDVPCVADCIPTAEDCIGADCIPSAGGGIPTTVGSGSLPFTGIEDTIAPILLALTVVLGGVVAWRWAQLRESVARDASTARPIPAKDATRTGYAAALRSQLIDQRARQVFTPRVA